MSSEAPENSQQATQPGAAGESQNGALSQQHQQQQSQSQSQSQSQQPPQQAEGEEEQDAVAPPPMEPRMPTRKDVSLRELLSKMDDNAPIVSRHFPHTK